MGDSGEETTTTVAYSDPPSDYKQPTNKGKGKVPVYSTPNNPVPLFSNTAVDGNNDSNSDASGDAFCLALTSLFGSRSCQLLPITPYTSPTRTPPLLFCTPHPLTPCLQHPTPFSRPLLLGWQWLTLQPPPSLREAHWEVLWEVQLPLWFPRTILLAHLFPKSDLVHLHPLLS